MKQLMKKEAAIVALLIFGSAVFSACGQNNESVNNSTGTDNVIGDELNINNDSNKNIEDTNDIITNDISQDTDNVTDTKNNKIEIIAAIGGYRSIMAAYTAVAEDAWYKIYIAEAGSNVYEKTNSTTNNIGISISDIEPGEYDIKIQAYADKSGNNKLTDLDMCQPVRVKVTDTKSNKFEIGSAVGGNGTITAIYERLVDGAWYEMYIAEAGSDVYNSTNSTTNAAILTISEIESGEYDIKIQVYSDRDRKDKLVDLDMCQPVRVKVK